PVRFALETYRGGYRFFYKHYGLKGLARIRWVYLIRLGIRWSGYTLINVLRREEAVENRLKMYRVAIRWNWHLNPQRFIETGAEPNLGYEPMAPAPKIPVPPADSSVRVAIR